MRRRDAAPVRGRVVVVWAALLFGSVALVILVSGGALWISHLVAGISGERAGLMTLETKASHAAHASHAPDASHAALRPAGAGPIESFESTDLTSIEPARRSAEQRDDSAAMHDGPTFDGRRLEKVKTLRMRVTAYSPDEQSCGIWADGITASGYSVWTNGMRLVAADTDLLPFRTIVSVPGYNSDQPVQVLDRGGAIKGHRLDVLFGTHERAMIWGVQDLEVTVWRYAE